MEPSKFLDEAEIMKKLKHPHIVTLYAVCSREEPIYIVCELMKNGSLLSCLRDDKQRSQLQWNRLLNIAAQV
jgi:fyn-related kinase